MRISLWWSLKKQLQDYIDAIPADAFDLGIERYKPGAGFDLPDARIGCLYPPTPMKMQYSIICAQITINVKYYEWVMWETSHITLKNYEQ